MSLLARAIVVVCCAIVAIVCGLMAMQTVNNIVRDVNVTLADEQRFSFYGWYPGKWRLLVREYRRLYPSGRCVRRYAVLAAFMVADVVVVAVALDAGLSGALFLAGVGTLSLWLALRRG